MQLYSKRSLKTHVNEWNILHAPRFLRNLQTHHASHVLFDYGNFLSLLLVEDVGIYFLPLMLVWFLDIQRSFKCRTIFSSFLVYAVRMLAERAEIITLADLICTFVKVVDVAIELFVLKRRFLRSLFVSPFTFWSWAKTLIIEVFGTRTWNCVAISENVPSSFILSVLWVNSFRFPF